MTAALSVAGVSQTFYAGTVNEKHALRSIDLRLEPGQFTTVIGSNGAGKSTLLNVVAGKLRPDQGTIEIADKDVTKLSDHRRATMIGRVFQDPRAGTAPELTIEENLAIAFLRGHRRGLRRGVTEARRELFVHELATLEQGLEHRLKTRVGILSGGQRQALSLLMATFSQPQLLLLDEHTAALDPQRAALVVRLTREMVQRHNPTTIMVTHNMEQALQLGDRLIMMHDGEIVVDVSGQRKTNATVADLMAAFEEVKGAELSDRTLLG